MDYQLAVKDGPSPERVTVCDAARDSADAVDTAQALIERGCQNQLDVLVAGLGEGE